MAREDSERLANPMPEIVRGRAEMAFSKLEVDDLARVATVSEARLSPDGEMVAYCVSSLDLEHDRERTELRLASVTGGPARSPSIGKTEGRAPRWSPDGSSIAFLAEDGGGAQLQLLILAGESLRRLTSFPCDAGPAVWSPSGDRIAVSGAVSPGSASRIAVVETATGSMELVPGGDHDDTAPAWSPDGAQLAFSRAERKPGENGPSSSIHVVQVGGGEDPFPVTTGLAFASCPSWSPDGRLLACFGTRDSRLGLEDSALQPWILPAAAGPARLAAFGINGVIVPRPPEGPLWSADGSWIFFREARAGDINVVGASVNDPEKVRSLTRDCQVTSLSASSDARRLAFSACTPVDPGSVYVYEAGAGTRRLTGTRRSGLPPGRVPRPVRRGFKSPHGYALDGWIQGRGSGPSPQPLLVSIHGGPHSFVGSGFQHGHFHRSVLASRGWIVLTLNASGSGSYGEAFADSIRGRWGEHDLPEHLSAIDDLVGEGLVDPGLLAVAGYSYGGYLAAWAVCHTSRFKAAVVGAPIANLESFHRTSDIGPWYGPWEMAGGLTTSSERFRRLSPVNYAERIVTPTLILHGETDRRCPIAQSEELHARISEAGRARAEIVRYSGAEHLFYSQGRPSQRLDYNRRIVEWIEEQVLGRASRPPATDVPSTVPVGSAGQAAR